ncbi:hypothetical protein ABPG74_010699 [Tetrahymena malaccensis]
MNCQGCNNQYNETDRSPRLLINCGHSICEKCTAELYRDGQIVCPECRFKNVAPMVTCFPRNLALININKQQPLANMVTPAKTNLGFQSSILLNSNVTSLYVNKENNQSTQQQNQNLQGITNTSLSNFKAANYTLQEITPPAKSQSQQSFYPITNTTSEHKTLDSNIKDANLLSERYAICQKHFKKFEAYCEDDQILLCITCILEDGHRQHSIDSIENSVQKQKQKQSEFFDQSRQQEKKAISIMQQIDANLKDLSSQAQVQLSEICSFFSEVKKIINEKESKLKSKVQDALLDQENQMKQLEKYYQNHISDVNEFQTLYRQCSVMQDVEYLKSLQKTKQIMSKINQVQQVDKIEFKQIQNFFSKDSELHALTKQMLSLQSLNQANQQNTLTAQVQLVQTKKQLNQAQQNNTSSNSNKEILANNNQTNNLPNQVANNPMSSSSTSNPLLQNKKPNTIYQTGNKPVTKRVQNRKDVASIGPLGITCTQQQNIYRTKSNQIMQKKDQTKEAIGTSYGNNSNQNCQQLLQQAVTTGNLNIQQNLNQGNYKLGRNDRSTSSTNPQSISSELNKPLNNYHELRNILKEKLTQQNNEQNINRGEKSLTPSKRISNYSNSSYQNDNLNFFNKEKNLPNISPLRSNNITNIQQQVQSSNNQLKQVFQINEGLPQNSKTMYSNQAQYKSTDKISQQDFNDTTQKNKIIYKPSSTQSKIGQIGQGEEFDDQNFQFIDNNSYPESARKDLFSCQLNSNNLNVLTSGQKPNSNTNSIMNSNNLIKSMRTDITDMFMNRCDFSTISTYQNGNFIYVFGGFIESSQYAIERFDISRNLWEQVDILPTNRAKFSMVGLDNGNILIIGGKQDGMRIALCEEYDPKTNKLSISSMMLSTPKSGFGAVNLGRDKIIIIGGNDGQNVQDMVEMYDKASLKLPKKLCSMIEKRDELAVTLGLDKKIYAIGGFGGTKNVCLRTAERYDPETDRWEAIAPLNVPRRALAAVTLPDGIYAIGGFDGQNYLSTVEKYDESLNQWIFISSMNFPRCTLSAVTSKDNQFIYVLGGFDNGPLDTVERYNIFEDKWEMYSKMSYKRFMHSSIMISGQFP